MTSPKRVLLVPTSPHVSKDVMAAALFKTTAGFAAVACNAEDVGGWGGDISGGATGERWACNNLWGSQGIAWEVCRS